MQHFTPTPRRQAITDKIAPTPYRLPKNEQVRKFLTLLLKAESYGIIKLEYDNSRSVAIVNRVVDPGKKIRWELRNKKAFKLYGRKRSRFWRAASVDDILDLLDGENLSIY